MNERVTDTPRVDALMAEYPALHLRPMEQREERIFKLACELDSELAEALAKEARLTASLREAMKYTDHLTGCMLTLEECATGFSCDCGLDALRRET
jgi:hypothetical protein